jgi:hypothetical protein
MGALILVVEDHQDRGTGGFSFEDSREQMDLISLFPGCGHRRLAGLAPVQLFLDHRLGDLDTWGGAV